MSEFKEKFRNTPATDWLVLILGALGLVLISPKVIGGLAKLQKTGDIIWNLALDLFIVIAWVLLVYVLMLSLRKFSYWAHKIERF